MQKRFNPVRSLSMINLIQHYFRRSRLRPVRNPFLVKLHLNFSSGRLLLEISNRASP